MILSILFSILMSPSITVTSPAFEEGKFIPEKYTCEGQNTSPEIKLANVPEKTVSLVLIMHDPDAPMQGGFTHWVMYNIKPGSSISENAAPGTQGANGKKESKYTGPCPPAGTHHYHFMIYALDKMLDLKEGATKDEVEAAMKGHVIATGELIGLYKKTHLEK